MNLRQIPIIFKYKVRIMNRLSIILFLILFLVSCKNNSGTNPEDDPSNLITGKVVFEGIVGLETDSLVITWLGNSHDIALPILAPSSIDSDSTHILTAGSYLFFGTPDPIMDGWLFYRNLYDNAKIATLDSQNHGRYEISQMAYDDKGRLTSFEFYDGRTIKVLR